MLIFQLVCYSRQHNSLSDRMKPIEKAAALDMLGQDIDLIHNCVRLGWEDFVEEFSPSQRVKLSSRSRASIVNDLIVLRARSAFETHLNAHCLDIQKMFVVAFQSGIAVRFKKLDEAFIASGIPTTQALDFVAQGALPGIGEGVHLHAGYRLDQFESELEGIYLTCPRGRSANYWWHELGKDADEGQGTIAVLPITPMDPGPLTEKPFKIVRRGGEEKDAAGKQ